jgi:predicted kinase
MQAIIFIGIQATGKTTFYQQNFLNTHVRISLDLLKTRHREMAFLNTCLQTQQKFVVDNTNPTIEDRERYMALAKGSQFEVIGYYFESKIRGALDRNKQRSGRQQIPEPGILGTYNKLELPSYQEGFDQLYYVRINSDGQFSVESWNDEI